MNIEQAKEALELGLKVAHQYYTSEEFIHINKYGQYEFEDGCIVSERDAFECSTPSTEWRKDCWKIYHEEPEIEDLGISSDKELYWLTPSYMVKTGTHIDKQGIAWSILESIEPDAFRVSLVKNPKRFLVKIKITDVRDYFVGVAEVYREDYGHTLNVCFDLNATKELKQKVMDKVTKMKYSLALSGNDMILVTESLQLFPTNYDANE